MNKNNLIKYALINNIYFMHQMKLSMLNTNNYQNFINQGNIPNLFSPNYYAKNYKYKTHNRRNIIPYNNNIQTSSFIQNRIKFTNFNCNNHPLNNVQNFSEKINFIKINKRRKSSLDTTNTNFKSSSNEEEENDRKEEIEDLPSKNNKEPNIILIPKRNEINSENKIINKTINENKNNNMMKKEEYEGNPIFENIEILRVNVKISKNKFAVFKLKRYDDIFETIKLFCEINLVDEKLIKPLIMKSLKTLNTIYQVMNCKLDEQQIKILQNAKNI